MASQIQDTETAAAARSAQPHDVPAFAIAPAAPASGALLLVAVVILYFGRDIFIPLALAVLLAFVLAPLVLWLRRVGLPRIPAVVMAVLLAFTLLGSVALVVGTQAVELAGNLPSYRRTISEKVDGLRNTMAGGGVIERVTALVRDLGRELSRPDRAAAPPAVGSRPADQQSGDFRFGEQRTGAPRAGEPTRREPIPVVIESGPTQPLDLIQTVLGPLIGPLGTAGLVVLFVVFILIEREDLRDRFIRLVGGNNLQRSTEAISEAATRVSRYLLAQLLINVSYGFPIGLGLWWIGVPNAVLWGLLATVLRFIPYIGPWLAALFPLALAFAVDPGWSMLLWVIGLFLVMELVSNNVVEPLAYGASTGLSTFAVIIAAIFWTTLWGPAGLFLATPLTVCLVVLGRYVPGLDFLGVLLGNDPVLAPEERFYQRLLAGNIEEAIEEAERTIAETSPLAFLDGVAIPALKLAESDRQRSGVVGFRRTVAEGVESVMREVAEIDGLPQPAVGGQRGGKAGEASSRPDVPTGRILAIGGRTELDEAAAKLLAGHLGELGITVEVLPPLAVGRAGIGQLDLEGVSAVCISYLDPAPHAYARYVCRRIGRRSPRTARIVCLWNAADAPGRDLVRDFAADAVTATIGSTAERVAALARQPLRGRPQPALENADRDALRALRKSGLETGRGPAFQRLAGEVADAFGSVVALVTLTEEGDDESHAGAGSMSAERREEPLGQAVVATSEPIVVEDVGSDPHWRESPLLLEKGIRAWAGVPIRGPSGAVIGALSLLASAPRAFPPADTARLADIAGSLAEVAEAAAPTRSATAVSASAPARE